MKMHQFAILPMMTVLMLFFSFPVHSAEKGSGSLKSVPTAQETRVLRTLERVRASVDTGVTFSRYSELVADARAELNILKKQTKKNDFASFFFTAALSQYDMAQTLWSAHVQFDVHSIKPMLQENWAAASEAVDSAYQVFIK